VNSDPIGEWWQLSAEFLEFAIGKRELLWEQTGQSGEKQCPTCEWHHPTTSFVAVYWDCMGDPRTTIEDAPTVPDMRYPTR
jgi:hypothetical protein